MTLGFPASANSPGVLDTFKSKTTRLDAKNKFLFIYFNSVCTKFEMKYLRLYKEQASVLRVVIVVFATRNTLCMLVMQTQPY